MPSFVCFNCQKSVEYVEMVGRGLECPHCRANAHCCKNCEFYDVHSYNECRETVAERVIDKESANFCSLFQPHRRSAQGKGIEKPDPRSAAEALFKKK